MGRQPTQHRRPKSAADPLDTVGWRALQLEFVGWRALPLWAGEPRHCGLESPDTVGWRALKVLMFVLVGWRAPRVRRFILKLGKCFSFFWV